MLLLRLSHQLGLPRQPCHPGLLQLQLLCPMCLGQQQQCPHHGLQQLLLIAGCPSLPRRSLPL